MDFTLEFFEYTKNCKEYQVLVKATSENATRKELKEGQIFFDKISTNCSLIFSKLSQIRNSVVEKNIPISGSLKERFNSNELKIKYKPVAGINFNSLIRIDTIEEVYYDWKTEIHEQKILDHLKQNFDHEEYKVMQKKRKNIKKLNLKIKMKEVSFAMM